MDLSFCQKSDLKIRKFILRLSALRRCQRPSRLQLSVHLMLGVTQTRKLSHSCHNKTTFHLTLGRCQRYVRQFLSLNLQAMRGEPLVLISMVRPLENLASQLTAKCLPTFRRPQIRQQRHLCHQHTFKSLNVRHRHFNKQSAWMI
jgi:hypothetical protein